MAAIKNNLINCFPFQAFAVDFSFLFCVVKCQPDTYNSLSRNLFCRTLTFGFFKGFQKEESKLGNIKG